MTSLIFDYWFKLLVGAECLLFVLCTVWQFWKTPMRGEKIFAALVFLSVMMSIAAAHFQLSSFHHDLISAFLLSSVSSLLALSLWDGAKQLKHAAKRRIIIKIPLLAFIIGLMGRRILDFPISAVLGVLLSLLILGVLFRQRESLRLALRSFVMALILLLIALAFSRFFEVTSLAILFTMVAIYFLYQTVNLMLVRGYISKKMAME